LSAYGTLDQGGDVWQWNEALKSGSSRGLRGGCFVVDSSNLASSYGGYAIPPTNENANFGFRVASVPEPSTVTLLLAGAACLLGFACRRRA
jgi:hypothetical protein